MEDVYKTTDKWNRFNESGHEELNPTPMQPPLGYVRQPSLSEQIRQQIQTLRRLEDHEPESEEEADDFDIPDDPPDIHSRWENDNIPSLKETRARMRELEKAEQALTLITPEGAPVAPPPNPSEPPLDE